MVGALPEGVHPPTVRYRMTRLRELFGGALGCGPTPAQARKRDRMAPARRARPAAIRAPALRRSDRDCHARKVRV